MALALSQGFRNIAYFFQNYELTEVILPFLLVFTIIFTVFDKIKLFGEGKKNIHVMLAFIISLLTIIPHITGRYPSGYDPINIINSMVPGAAVLAVVIILIIFLLGMFGSTWLTGNGAPGWAMIIIFGVLLYIFGTTVGWWTSPNNFFSSSWDSDLSMTLVALGVLGIAILFITGPQQHQPIDRIVNWLGGRH